MLQALTSTTVALLITLAIGPLQGCSSHYPASFSANGTPYRLSRDQAIQLRDLWIEPTDEVISASTTNPYDRSFIFTFIAHAYTVTLPAAQRCPKVALTGVRRLSLDEIHEKTSVGTVEVLRPVYFAELWQVEACGRRETWRALGMWSTVHLRRMVTSDA